MLVSILPYFMNIEQIAQCQTNFHQNHKEYLEKLVIFPPFSAYSVHTDSLQRNTPLHAFENPQPLSSRTTFTKRCLYRYHHTWRLLYPWIEEQSFCRNWQAFDGGSGGKCHHRGHIGIAPQLCVILVLDGAHMTHPHPASQLQVVHRSAICGRRNDRHHCERRYEIRVPDDVANKPFEEQKEVLLKWTTGISLIPLNARVKLCRRV